MYQLQRDKNINMLYRVIISAGLVCSLLHLTQFLFDMALSIPFYDKVNVPSIAYLICHLLIMYIPLLLLTPNLRIPKAVVLKWVFIGISVCYLLGNTWIFYYMFTPGHSPTGIFVDHIDNLYLYQRNTALLFNYMTWNCYSPLNVVFNFVQAFLFFIMAKSIYRYKAVFISSIILTTIISASVIVIYTVFPIEPITIAGHVEQLSKNLINNVYLLSIQLTTSIGLLAISTSHNMWGQVLWSYAEKR